MAETRSKVQLKEISMKEVEEAFGSRFEAIKEDLEKNLVNMIGRNNEKVDKRMADIFEAIRLVSVNKVTPVVNEETSTARSRPLLANPQTQHLDPAKERDDSQVDYQGMTRLSKLDFPRFNGEKVQEWLFKADHFFAIDSTPPTLKISIASIHLDGTAATWHQSLVQSNSFRCVDWFQYKALLLERFGEVMDDPIAELKQLQETDGIVEYHGKFELIKTRVTLPEEYLVSAYLAGLRIDTQMHVRMFQPQSIRQCLLLGRLYEKAHPRRQVTTNWVKPYKEQLPVKKSTEVVVHKEGFGEVKPQGRRRLSPEEMSKRRALGLCYFCDEKYSPEHYQKHKNTQLYYLSAVEDDMMGEEEINEVIAEPDDVAQISMNAIAGVSDYKTMRVKGTHGKQDLYILIDSGSTHNFLDEEVARRLGCKFSPAGMIKVKVADGRQVGVKAKVEGFKWYFQEKEFKADMMAITLGGCDMVLGCQWLETLGPITWDFRKLHMSFLTDNGQVTLSGIHHDSLRVVKAAKINKLRGEEV